MINCNCQKLGLFVRTLKNAKLHILRVEQLWTHLFLSKGENETMETGAGGDETTKSDHISKPGEGGRGPKSIRKSLK